MPAHEAELTFPCPDAASAEALAAALRVEVHDLPEGVAVDMRADGDLLAVHVRSRDLSGLRAAVGNLGRLAHAAGTALQA